MINKDEIDVIIKQSISEIQVLISNTGLYINKEVLRGQINILVSVQERINIKICKNIDELAMELDK